MPTGERYSGQIFVVTEFDDGRPPRVDELAADGEEHDVHFDGLSFRRGFGKLYVDHESADDIVLTLAGDFRTSHRLAYGCGYTVTVNRERDDADALVYALTH